jgi:hypothetical protein
MPDPRDNIADLVIPGQTRWALRIRGTDDAGQPHLLGIDWDGRPHALHPETGEPTRLGAVVKFSDLLPGEVAFSIKPGDGWPYAACLGHDRFIWARRGGDLRPKPLAVWDGHADQVRIFVMGVTTTDELRRAMDDYAVQEKR